ncbi:MAG: AAA family ATPase [Acidobacteriota bacterium]
MSEHDEGAFSPPEHWRMLDVAELAEWVVQPLAWLVKGIIAKGNLVLLAAPTQTCKTLLSLYLAELLVRGGKLFGQYEVKPGSKVLYLALEDPDRRIRDRLLDIEKGFGDGTSPTGEGHFQVYFASGLSLNDKRYFDYLEELIVQEGFDFVFLDTYQKATPGLSSFADEAQSKILHRLSDLTRMHFVTLAVLDHLRKESSSKRRGQVSIDDIKGTGGKAQNADVVILLERRRGRKLAFRSFSKDADQPVEILLSVSQQGSGAEKFQYAGKLEEGGGSRQGEQTKRRVLAAFQSGESLSTSKVAARTKASDATARRYLMQLVEEGRLIRTGHGPKTKYVLAEDSDNQSTEGMSG